MPMVAVNAQLFMKYKGVPIYHTYHHESFESRSDYWYSLSPDDETDYEFDIRSLPAYSSESNSSDDLAVRHEKIIRKAIDDGDLEDMIEAYYDEDPAIDREEPQYVVALATISVKIPVRGDKFSAELQALGSACAKVLQATLTNEFENNPVDIVQDLDETKAAELDGDTSEAWVDRGYELL